MNKKWLTFLIGAAAAVAAGYGMSRYSAARIKKKDSEKPRSIEERKEREKDIRISRKECPSCGKPVNEYEFFCPYCGHTAEEKK